MSTRLFLANEMMLDPRGNSFNEMRRYAESVMVDLYEPHDGCPFESNQELWDEALLFSVKNDLDSNFSCERLDYYYDVAKEVLKEKAASLEEEERKAPSKEAPHTEVPANASTENNFGDSNKKTHIGIIAGSVVIGAAGIILKKAALTKLGVAGVVIGGILMYKEGTK